MLTLKDVSLMRGTKLLFEDVSLAFYAGQRVGIVGRNGCGKSSLMALFLGDLSSSSGEISFANNVCFAHVEQEIPNCKQRVLDYVLDADSELRELQNRLVQAEQNNDGMQIATLYARLEEIDGFRAETRAAKLLDGLGFDQLQMQKNVNELSGGWRVRLNLARALMQRSDILLLDEPTNHLDLDAVVWLESWLKQYSGLLLLISHDREFLDNVVDRIAHIENKQIKLYSGNYSRFEKTSAEQEVLQQKQFQRQQKKREHLESYVNRFRAKATKARQAQSRLKALEKMEELAPIYAKLTFTFKFLPPVKMPHSLLRLEHGEFAYEQGKTILNDIEFNVEAEQRVALLGRNGAGKSTLIKILAGELKPQKGVIEVNPYLKVGYFAQYALDSLDLTGSALTNLKQIDRKDANEKVLRSFLGGFAFSGDMALQEVGTLSGGERARLCLALLVWQKPNLLLLDEPTNHLDMDMREALLLALQDYQGAVILVSHDRYLVNSAVDELYLVHDRRVDKYAGDLQDYQKWLLSGGGGMLDAGCGVGNSTRNVENKGRNENSKHLKSIERKLEKLHKKLAMLDDKLADPKIYNSGEGNATKVKEISTKRAKLQSQIDILEEEWLQFAS